MKNTNDPITEVKSIARNIDRFTRQIALVLARHTKGKKPYYRKNERW